MTDLHTQPWRGVIFDMDGTLIEPAIDFAGLRLALGLPTEDLLTTLAAWDAPRRDQAMAIIERFEHEAAARMALRAGALELMTWLRARQLPVAIVTRNTHARVLQLEALLAARFDVILDRTFTPPKPHAAPLHHIASRWGAPPHALLMVGDSAHDLDSARAAQMPFALVTHDDNAHHVPDADWSVDRLDALIAILDAPAR